MVVGETDEIPAVAVVHVARTSKSSRLAGMPTSGEMKLELCAAVRGVSDCREENATICHSSAVSCPWPATPRRATTVARALHHQLNSSVVPHGDTPFPEQADDARRAVLLSDIRDATHHSWQLPRLQAGPGSVFVEEDHAKSERHVSLLRTKLPKWKRGPQPAFQCGAIECLLTARPRILNVEVA